MDEPEYLVLAEGYRHGYFHRMISEPGAPVNLPAGPLFPLLLAGVQTVAGEGFRPAHVFVAALYPVLGALLALLLLRRFHPFWAAFGALTACLSFWMAEFSWQAMTEIPFTLTLIIAFLAVGSWERSSAVKRWGLIAALTCAVLAYFIREAGIALGLSLLFWLLLRRRWRLAAIAATLVLLAPVVWHQALHREVAAVGRTFGSTHLSFVGGRGVPADAPLSVGVAAIARTRPSVVAELVTSSLPMMLRFTKGAGAIFPVLRTKQAGAAVGLVFLLSAVVGALLLLWERRSDGVVGVFVLIYLAVVLCFVPAIRFLVPVFPFMWYAALHCWARLGQSGRWMQERRVRPWSTAVAVLGAASVLFLTAHDTWGQARYRLRARAGLADPPFAERVANARAADWIGKAFPAMSETVGSFKPPFVYIVGHQMTAGLPATEDLPTLRQYLDENGITLILEDGWTPGAALLHQALTRGKGSCFRSLAAFRQGSGVARVWRYLPTPDTPAAEPRVPASSRSSAPAAAAAGSAKHPASGEEAVEAESKNLESRSDLSAGGK
jgi:hypothetical protein